MSKLIFEATDTTMEFSLNPWDSKAFDRNCYELQVDLGNAPPLRNSVRHFMENNGVNTVTCRVESSDYQLRDYIQSLGFIHVELQLTCRLIVSEDLAPSRQLGTLRLAHDHDRPRIHEIAKTSFLNTRFRHIPNLSPDKIGARFANWASQLQDEHSQFAYVLEANDIVIGFFFSKPTTNKNEVYVALGGISTDCRGPYGYYLYPAVMTAYYRAGIRTVLSAIAADNLGALNLWASIGTKFPQATDFFMWNATKQI